MKNQLFWLLALFFLASCESAVEDMPSSPDSYRTLTAPGSNGGGQGEIEAGQITAGEWNDLSNWSFWKALFQKEDFSKVLTYWDFEINKRISVNLKNSSNEALVDIQVLLLNKENQILWEAKTDNFGKAELWTSNNAGDSTADLILKINNQTYENIKTFEDGVNQIVIDDNTATNEKIDIAFVVDATGSMGDELEYLKVELVDVIEVVKNENPAATINMSSVFYRDEGDEYVTRTSPFSTNINNTVNFIKEQSAEGGGDFPEAVHTALNEAINNLQWSGSAHSRVLFLMLDAPPHYDPQVVDKIYQTVKQASKKGI
ncbi:MAG TPA: vWA domain-containing protein, partial [Cytophagales bacterium]|nr:vWA domain-containing protein [Cytophagales bacterium]